MNSPTRFCTSCGSGIQPGQRFCANCGAEVDGTTAATEVPRSVEEELELQLRTSLAGEYEILGLIGRGGMAIVYQARDVHLGREVAIKILPPEMAFGSGMVERFKREARTAAQLNHPNIIPIYRIGEVGRTVYFAMKYVEGRGLDEILGEVGRLEHPVVASILQHVTGALGYAHRKGVIHRDIKPSNIMIDDEGWVYVMDFGIAKAAGSSTLTATGAAIGTPHYMSPEQCGGQSITPLSDQYSLGVMTYQMLAGQVPFDGDTVPEIISKHYFEQPPPLNEQVTDLPASVVSAVHKAMEKKPENRFESLDDFVAALVVKQGAEEVRTQMVALASGKRAKIQVPPTPSPIPPASKAVHKSGDNSALSEAATTPMPASRKSRGAAEAARIAATPTTPVPPPSRKAEPEAGDKRRSKVPTLAAAVGVVAVLGIGVALLGPFGGDGDSASGENPPELLGARPATGADDPMASDSGNAAGEGDTSNADSLPGRTAPAGADSGTVDDEPEPTLPAPSPAVIRFRNLPSGASATVDGSPVGNRSSLELEPGSHRVVITASGYETYRETVTLAAGADVTINGRNMRRVVERTPDPTPPEREPNHPSCELSESGANRIAVSGQAVLRLTNCVPDIRVRVNRRPSNEVPTLPQGEVDIIIASEGYATERHNATVEGDTVIVFSGALQRRP